MRLVWQLLAVVAVAFVGGQGVAAVEDTPWLVLVAGVLAAVLAVLVYRWVVGRTERRPVTELALEDAPAALGRGTLTGAALFGAVVVNLFTAGYWQPAPPSLFHLDRGGGPPQRVFPGADVTVRRHRLSAGRRRRISTGTTGP
jgi:hypothetical protein